MTPPARLTVGDIIKLKKKHPCSSDTFKIARVGSDIRIICTNCQRDLTFERQKLEKTIKAIITAETAEN